MTAYQTEHGQSLEINGRSYQEIVAAAHAARSAKVAELSATAIAGIGKGLKVLVTRLTEARKRRAAATRLATLDDRMLHDIGLSRSDISLAVSGAGAGYAPQLAGFERAGYYANENGHRRAA